MAAGHGRVLAGAEAAGVFESRDGGATWSLLSTLDDQPGRGDWNNPERQPPGHLGMPAIMLDPEDPNHFWVTIQGFGVFETTDNAASFTPRNHGLRAEWPLEHPEVGFCVHKLVMSPVDHSRMYQQNHCGMHRSDDAGHSWTEITEGLPTDFGFAAAAHPHDRDSFYVIPLDPGHGRFTPDGRVTVWRTGDAGAGWRAARTRPPTARRLSRRAARRACDRQLRRARPLLRYEHGPAVRKRRRGRVMGRDRELPALHLLGRSGGRGVAVAALHLPATLPRLFTDLPRELEIEAATVSDAIDGLEQRWPGMRDRLCEPGRGLRPHINVYVDRERAGLDTALQPRSRVDILAAISGG